MKADRHRCADGCLPAIGCRRTPLPSRDPGPRAGGVPSSCPSPALPRGQLPPGAAGLRKGHPCWEGSALQGPGEEVLALLQAEGSASGQRASASCPTAPGAPSPAPGHLALWVARQGPRHPQEGGGTGQGVSQPWHCGVFSPLLSTESEWQVFLPSCGNRPAVVLIKAMRSQPAGRGGEGTQSSVSCCSVHGVPASQGKKTLKLGVIFLLTESNESPTYVYQHLKSRLQRHTVRKLAYCLILLHEAKTSVGGLQYGMQGAWGQKFLSLSHAYL